MKSLKELMLAPPPLTMAIAESVTCGRLQVRVGAISGASKFFLGGITAYSLEQKARHLGVNPAEAKAVNSVSAGVAEQMARGACLLFGSDLAVATTGYAEPSEEWKVEAPFAYWGVARKLPDGGFAARSGRVAAGESERVWAQEIVAVAALAAFVEWIKGIRARKM